jgi:hypothetical protein
MEHPPRISGVSHRSDEHGPNLRAGQWPTGMARLRGTHVPFQNLCLAPFPGYIPQCLASVGASVLAQSMPYLSTGVSHHHFPGSTDWHMEAVGQGCDGRESGSNETRAAVSAVISQPRPPRNPSPAKAQPLLPPAPPAQVGRGGTTATRMPEFPAPPPPPPKGCCTVS